MFVWVLCLVLVLLFITLCPIRFAIILMGKRELTLSCVASNVFLIYCDTHCSVALAHGVVGWYAVCDCGIS